MSAGADEVVRRERRADGVAVVTLNRPRALNALSLALARGIAEALAALDADPAVRAVVLTGAGERAFSAGVDLREGRAMQVADIEGWFGTVCDVYRQILLTEKPVVAALNGLAAGGGFQIALVSDLRIGHPGVRMGQPEINAGIPSIMGSYWMSLHLGRAKNQELSMTGRLMAAEECHRLGLLNELVPADRVVARAAEIGLELAAKPPTAWRHTKARFRELALAGFDEAFRAGVRGQEEAYASGEPQAVMDAFLSRKGKGGGGAG